MTNWFGITTYENWKIINNSLIWGQKSSYKTIMSQTHIGDKLIIYVGRRIGNKVEKNTGLTLSSIMGIYEIISPSFVENSKIFGTIRNQESEIYPVRIKLKLVKLFNPPLKFKYLINSITFIKNKEMWWTHIRGRSIFKISEEDFIQILDSK